MDYIYALEGGRVTDKAFLKNMLHFVSASQMTAVDHICFPADISVSN